MAAFNSNSWLKLEMFVFFFLFCFFINLDILVEIRSCAIVFWHGWPTICTVNQWKLVVSVASHRDECKGVESLFSAKRNRVAPVNINYLLHNLFHNLILIYYFITSKLATWSEICSRSVLAKMIRRAQVNVRAKVPSLIARAKD